MIASYIVSYIGSFIALPQNGDVISKQQSLETYTAVFGYVAIGILVTTIIMVILTPPILNKYINRIQVIDDHKVDIDNFTYHPEN